MAQLQWTIDGRRFNSPEEYEAALRDKQLINQIIGNLSLGKPKDIELIYQKLQLGKYKFETAVGRQFDDNIYELYQQIKREQVEKEASRKKRKDRLLLKAAGQTHEPAKIIKFSDYDKNMQKEIVEQLKKRARKRRLVATGCILLCLTCFAYIGIYQKASQISQAEYDELAALKETSRKVNVNTKKQVTVHLTQEDIEVPDILPEYQMLYEKNPDLVGWIKIDNTVIDYPVMQTTDNEYYLNHDFDKENDKNGSIFLDSGCDILRENDNLILYGHHMRSGNMFGSLNKYKSESYLQEHPTIQFDTLYEHGTYQVMYVFQSKVFSEEEVTFKYYQFINASSEKEFNSYMNEMARLSLYDTGVSASYGDKLLTLSTCDYQENKGRLVVVAKKV